MQSLITFGCQGIVGRKVLHPPLDGSKVGRQGPKGGYLRSPRRRFLYDPLPKTKRKERRLLTTKKELTKAQRIRRVFLKLRRLLRSVPEERRKAAEGLMHRVAFMEVTLEDLEADINEHGTIERFSQTEGIEYDRERPSARIYNTTFRNYGNACKQLFDLLPAGEKTPAKEDELMSFVKRASR